MWEARVLKRSDGKRKPVRQMLRATVARSQIGTVELGQLAIR